LATPHQLFEAHSIEVRAVPVNGHDARSIHLLPKCYRFCEMVALDAIMALRHLGMKSLPISIRWAVSALLPAELALFPLCAAVSRSSASFPRPQGGRMQPLRQLPDPRWL